MTTTVRERKLTSGALVKGVILVGGPSRGTRFRPLSLNKPKPLFPIAGKPMIYHHLYALSKVVHEVLLIGYYEPEAFTTFIETAQAELGISIKYLREYQALGTGGGIYHFRDQILRGNPDYFFVLNADVCCSFPLREMVNFHIKHQKMATVLTTNAPHKEDVINYGCIVEHPESHQVLHYVEKPQTFVSDLISCGVYIFSRSVFPEFQKIKLADEFDCDRIQLETDVVSSLAASGELYNFKNKEFWCQLKTPGSAVPANRLYLDFYSIVSPQLIESKIECEVIQPVYIHPTAQIHFSAKIGPNVSIGANSNILEGVRIRDAIILDNVTIKENACVINSIIGWDCSLGQWSRVEGTPEPLHISEVTKNGVKIPNTTILSNEVNVNAEVIIRNCIVLPHKDLSKSYHNEILL